MKKISWPYSKAPESDEGPMSPDGSFKDIAPLSNDGSVSAGYATLNPELSTLDSDPEIGADDGHEYSGGTFFPLHDDIDDHLQAEANILNAMSNAFISKFGKNSTLIGWGKQTDELLAPIRSLGINIISLSKLMRDSMNLNSFASVNSDIMFYNHRIKCDGFFNSNPFSSLEESEIAINNIYANLKPKAYAMFLADKDIDIETIAKRAGFKVIARHQQALNKIIVKKNSFKRMALVKHYGNKNDSISSFICNIAETQQDKIMGLQPYSSLSNNCGLLFKYDKPESLTFHMGSVKFPIDIAFIDENDVIKKIYSNIQPGSLDIFTCADSKNVLEVCGGITDALGIAVGDRVFFEYDEGAIEKHSFDFDAISDMPCVIKTSSSLDTQIKKYNNFSILTKNINDLKIKTNIIKTASINSEQKIAVFNLNDFISNDIVPFYRRDNGQNSRYSLSLFSESFETSGDMIKVSLEKFYENNFYKNIRKNYLPNLSDVMYVTSKNNFELLNKIKKYLNNNYKVSFIYSGNYDSNLLKEAVEISLNAGSTNSYQYNLSNSECIKIPLSYNLDNVIEAMNGRYQSSEIDIVFDNLEKTAGVPVDNETKAMARKCINYLDRAKKYAAELRDNLEHNLSVYNKLAEKPEVIKNSAGEYSESSKRNSKVCKRVLINIKESIKILNSIQDVSTTEEVISSLADLSKIFSASAIAVFDLVNVIDLDDFVANLEAETKKASGSSEDLILAIERSKSYITKDILGIIILSE